MEGPRAAKADELLLVIQLINNTFKISENLPPTMEKEFPLLLCENNLDNIRIVTDMDAPIAAVNYYNSNILINGCKIKTASVGAVCTASKYRGQNIATKILDDVEEKLRVENTDIMLVSGTRSLYLNRGCCIVGGFYRAELLASEGQSHSTPADNTVEVIEFNQNYIKNMAEIYSTEAIRYHRSRCEFEKLLMGSTASLDGSTFRVFLIKKNMDIVGYIVLKISYEDKAEGYIIEYSGDREAIYNSLYNIISICSIDKLTLALSKYDNIKSHFDNDNIKLCEQNQSGSVKIINFKSFMDNLKPYFIQYLPYKTMEAMKFYQDSRGYIFNINNEEFCIEDLKLMTQLVFGRNVEMDLTDYLPEDLKDKPSIKEFIETVFPLPFPWVGNMNFI